LSRRLLPTVGANPNRRRTSLVSCGFLARAGDRTIVGPLAAALLYTPTGRLRRRFAHC
jgi:hypothetical protein